MISVLKWLFARDSGKKMSCGQTILWWETRRIPLNIVLIAGGMLVYFCIAKTPLPGSMIDRDTFGLHLAETLLILANALYTTGWIVEAMLCPFFRLWFLREPDRPLGWYESILWWEVRRIPFNLFAILLAVFEYLFFIFILSPGTFSMPDPHFFSSRAMVVIILLLNILYTAGSLLEILVRAALGDQSTRLGPGFLGIWLVLTALLPLLPVGVLLAFGIYRLLFDDCFGLYCL